MSYDGMSFRGAFISTDEVAQTGRGTGSFNDTIQALLIEYLTEYAATISMSAVASGTVTYVGDFPNDIKNIALPSVAVGLGNPIINTHSIGHTHTVLPGTGDVIKTVKGSGVVQFIIWGKNPRQTKIITGVIMNAITWGITSGTLKNKGFRYMKMMGGADRGYDQSDRIMQNQSHLISSDNIIWNILSYKYECFIPIVDPVLGGFQFDDKSYLRDIIAADSPTDTSISIVLTSNYLQQPFSISFD